MKNLKCHPGITVHRMAVGGSIMGALFAIGAVLIFVIGLPVSRWFLLGSVLLGTGVAAVLHIWHKNNPVELADLHHPPPPEPTKQP